MTHRAGLSEAMNNFLFILLYAFVCAVVGSVVVAAYHVLTHHSVEQYELFMGAIIGLAIGFVLEEILGRIRLR